MADPFTTSSPVAPGTEKPPPPVRRAFTLPAKLTNPQHEKSPTHSLNTDSVEVLYTHPRAKIISFSPLSATARPGSSHGKRGGDIEQEPVGVLPWASPTERTMAAGPLRLYRVPGSVVFLHSGSTLHAILGKSQCWCVDGESKFVLRIRADNYYRIEFPGASSEEKSKIEELKTVLNKILQYEKTPCPFKRGFTVELPEAPKTPIMKRPWRPPERSTPLRIQTPARLESEDEDYLTAASDNDETESLDGKSFSDASEDNAVTPRGIERMIDHENMQSPSRPSVLSQGRSVTTPLRLELAPLSVPSTAVPIAHEGDLQDSVTASLSSSIDSFHSFHSPISPFPPSPPDSGTASPSSLNCEAATPIVLPRRPNHRRDMSELTITSELQPIRLFDGAKESLDHSKSAAADNSERSGRRDTLVAPSNEQASRQLRRRDLSPMPLPANIFIPSSPATSPSLTTALVQKTYSLMMGPPLNLVVLMLRIAAKIANGALKGVTTGLGDSGERLTYRWDYTDEHEDAWGEDDFGIPLREHTSNGLRKRDVGESWEMD